MDKKAFEIEVRGLLNKEQYDKLVSFLDNNAERKEKDNKITDFFEIPNSTLKVANCTDKQNAKIAFKLGDIASSIAQEEFEFPIEIAQTDNMVKLFTKLLAHLGHPIIYHVEQKRVNYWIEDYEFAVKWTESFGYHYEAEVIVSDKSEINKTREKLEEYVKSLDLPVMNEKEFIELANQVRNNHSNVKEVKGN